MGKKGGNLFDSLEELMLREHPYLKNNLTRKELADMLNTNERYLAEAIRLGPKGQTFREYINSYRIKYARKLLITHPEIPVQVIVAESGFASRATFYRLYKEIYHEPPTRHSDLSE